MDYKIFRFRQKYKSGIIKLLRILWPGDFEERLSIFNWKYNENSYLEKPYAYVALDNDRVIAFRGFFPSKYILDGVTFTALSPCDMVVDQEYRRQGLFESMTKFAMDEIYKEGEINFYINLSSNEYSTPGYLKLGWEPVEIKRNLFSSTIFGFLENYIYNKFNYNSVILNTLHRFFYISSSSDKKEGLRYIRNNFEEISKRLALSFDYKSERFNLEKDNDFFSWRLRKPSSKYFIIYKENENKIITSYFLLISKGSGKYLLGDFLYDELEDLQEFFKLLVTTKKISILETWGFGKDASSYNDLISLGFKYNTWFKNLFIKEDKIPFLVRPTNPKLNPKSWILNDKDIRDSNSWLLNPIASDGN